MVNVEILSVKSTHDEGFYECVNYDRPFSLTIACLIIRP